MKHPFRACIRAVVLVALAAPFVAPGWAASSSLSDEDLELFESKIRPVLVENCYVCHGADPKKIFGGLVLTHSEGLMAGGDSGPVVVPGDPDASLLIEALRYDGLTQMPPTGKLPQHVIADFELWVKRGAPDPRAGGDTPVMAQKSAAETYDYSEGRKHWAYRAIARPQPPDVEAEEWVQRDLDRFVLSALESRGLEPAPPADKRTLLRRVTFDLIGLAPTEEEIGSFLADDSPQAFAKVVDRLLASPRYGERWGRHWLDIARYADSNGLDENIAHRNAFRYRDYVIESFNEDKPFDQFVHEQIAGDLLPAASDAQRYEQMTGTGFLMMGPKVLAERDREKLLIDIVDEQVHTIGRAFLAEPIGCARCHDHKFDPIPTSDYYAMAGILRSTRTMANAAAMRWVERPITDEATLEEYEAARNEVREAKAEVAALRRSHDAPLRAPRREAIARYLLAAEEVYDVSLPYLRALENNDEEAERPDVIDEVAQVRALEAAVLERWASVLQRTREGKPSQGDAPKPYLVFEVWNGLAAAPGDMAGAYERVRTQVLSEKMLIPPLARSILRGPAPRSLEQLAYRYESLFAVVDIAWQEHQMRLATQSEEERKEAGGLPREQEELRWILYGDGLGRHFCIVCLDPDDEAALYPEGARKELARLEAEVARLEKLVPPEPPYVMAVQEDEAVDLPVHIRGSHLNLAKTKVPRGFLRVTDHVVPQPPVPSDASGRLELARWITHPEHPLTSRVIVNRVWHWLFGRGLVDTPSNFGTTGSKPSHPELLDYLARRFTTDGWSIKKLQRQILLSSTYQLSSSYSASNTAVDEQNRYLWRMNRKRLEAEPIRDVLLQLSGRLDLTMGGRVAEYDPRGYVFDEGSTFGEGDFYAAPRRSVYLPVVRNAIYNVFTGFDFGDASDSVGRRSSTVVPPQALLMMNSPFVEEQAEGFAERLLESSSQASRRVETAFVRAYGRPATETEVQESLQFLDAMRAASDATTAQERELFAWTRLCQVILAASEMIYVG